MIIVIWPIAPDRGRTGRFRLGGDQALRTDTGELSEISFEDFAVAVIDEAEQARHSHARFTVAY